MNRLFVAYKPQFVSSNAFLQRLKRKYGVKKAGFSGTLDPFACGTLVVAFGAYTRLFRFLKKYPKEYVATLWLGAHSPSLDIERVEKIDEPLKFPLQKIEQVLQSFKGSFTYTPPKYSAKKIGGRRAYTMTDQHIELAPVTSTIHSIELLNYSHPFVTFRACVSEGTYIRSLAEHIAARLGCAGALSYLERTKEGAFVYEDERALDPVEYLITKPNRTTLSPQQIQSGTKIGCRDLAICDDGLYHLLFDEFFTIIEIADHKVKYLLNNIPRYRHA